MKKKLLSVFAVAAASTVFFAGCAAMGPNYFPNLSPDMGAAPSDEMVDDAGDHGPNFQYESIVEQGFHKTVDAPSSYFSLDRNTASYSQVRAQINTDRKVAADSVRIEELVNYFSYSFPAPEEGEEIRATTYLSDCPWNADNKLVTVGVRTEERKIEAEFNNYVLLIDVSGSMSARVNGLEGTTVMELVKYGIEKLVSGMTEHDCISIVTYASGVGVKLEPTLANKEGKSAILKAVRQLNANGSTNGAGGLQLAYEQAEKYYSEDGNNRVILMSDGDFNVGMHRIEDLKELIQEKAQSGVYLSVLGFGLGNMRDDLMQTLALNGNGNYAYIDTPQEAEKVLCEELSGTLVTVAKDAKASVTFDAELVSRYRLLGYDMKLLSEDDFNNSEKDAGEIGSNLTAIAVYEVELMEACAEGEKLADVVVRYKSAGENEEDREVTATVENVLSQKEDVAFISCVLEFGLVLRNSAYRANATLSAALGRLNDMQDYLAADYYKTEFKELIEKAIGSKKYE